MTSEQVRRWLEKNPDFFQQYPEILFNSGTRGQIIPIDLGELIYLRKERKHLNNQIQDMMAQARQNEEIQRAFHTIMVHMISAGDLTTLIRGVTNHLEVAFSLNRVTVALCPAQTSLEKPPANLADCIFLIDEKTLKNTFGTKNKAIIRIGQEGFNRQQFFGDDCEHIRSEVLIPMGRPSLPGFSQPVGSLNLGAEKPTRFLPSQSTDLLQDLADIFAICLRKLLPSKP